MDSRNTARRGRIDLTTLNAPLVRMQVPDHCGHDR
jgi:hypothetical protein